MNKGHCEKPCDVQFVDLEVGEHDWASIDFWFREHCGLCGDGISFDLECHGKRIEYPAVTSEMLRLQRYEFTNRGFGPRYDLRNHANYYAPDRWTMYDPAEGNQNRLWDRRRQDGVYWSAFLAHNIAREFVRNPINA